MCYSPVLSLPGSAIDSTNAVKARHRALDFKAWKMSKWKSMMSAFSSSHSLIFFWDFHIIFSYIVHFVSCLAHFIEDSLSSSGERGDRYWEFYDEIQLYWELHYKTKQLRHGIAWHCIDNRNGLHLRIRRCLNHFWQNLHNLDEFKIKS